MVSDSTLSTDVFTEIRNKIVAAAPYVTNSTTSSTSAASILAVHNDTKTTIPQIVINPIVYDEANWKFGGTEGKKFINVIIDCYYKNTLGIDQMSDQVLTALKVNDISGIDLVGVTGDYAFNVNNEAKFHLKSTTFTYDRE